MNTSTQNPQSATARLDAARNKNLNIHDLVYEALSLIVLIPQIDDIDTPLERNGLAIISDFAGNKLHAVLEMLGDQKDTLDPRVPLPRPASEPVEADDNDYALAA